MRRLRCAWATAPAARFLSERPVRRGATRSRAWSGGAAIVLAVRCMRHILYVMSALSPSFPGGLHASAMAADGSLRAPEQPYYCCCLSMSLDTLAERLRRRPAKPMGSPCVGSNPTGVASSADSGPSRSCGLCCMFSLGRCLVDARGSCARLSLLPFPFCSFLHQSLSVKHQEVSGLLKGGRRALD